MSEALTQEPPAAEVSELVPPPVPQPKPVTPPMTVTNGLQLTTLAEMEEFARYAIASGFAPDGVTTASQGVIALQIGAELGLTPMLSLQSIAIVHKRPTLWGDAMLGLCQQSRWFDHAVFKEWFTGTPMQDDWTAHTQCRRIIGVLTERTFSVADAKRADLWDNTKKSTWNTHPQRMLKYKARAFALRDTFADVLRGLHAAEEMIDVDQVLSQIDMTGTTRTEQLKQHLKDNGVTPPTDPSPEVAQPAVASPGTGPTVATAVPEPPTPAEPTLSRDELWDRFKVVKPSLTAPQLTTLRNAFGLKMLAQEHVDKVLPNIDQLTGLVLRAEGMASGAEA